MFLCTFLSPPLVHPLTEGDFNQAVWALCLSLILSVCLFRSLFSSSDLRQSLECSLRFKEDVFIFYLRDSCFQLDSLMRCVTEMCKTSCLCFPQISKCLISGCVAVIHNARAEYGSVTHPECRLLLHLLSPHLLYLTGLLFSLNHSAPLRGPNSALSSCLARSSCNSHASPPVYFLSYWPPRYCGAVEVLEVYRTIENMGSLHWGLRGKNSALWLYLLLEEYEERKLSQKQKAASGLWTGSNPSSWGSPPPPPFFFPSCQVCLGCYRLGNYLIVQ